MKRSLVGFAGLALAVSLLAPPPARAATTHTLAASRPLLATEAFRYQGCPGSYIGSAANGIVERVVEVGGLAGQHVPASFAADAAAPNALIIANYLTGACSYVAPAIEDGRGGPGPFTLRIPANARWVVFTMLNAGSARITF